MRKSIRITSVLLVLVSILSSLSVMAVEPRASYYVNDYGGSVVHTGGGDLVIDFHVWGTNKMDEIGAQTIVLQYSHDNSTWHDLKTFRHTDTDYSNMMSGGTLYYGSFVEYGWVVGLYYRAEITIYAGKGGNGDSRTFTTTAIFASA